MNQYVRQAITILQSGEKLPDSLTFQISQLKQKDLNWTLFDALYNNPYEKASGYWTTAKVAMELMQSKIITVSQQKVECRLRYDSFYEDFQSEMWMLFQERLQFYDPTKSRFPQFIEPYILNLGVNFDKDISYYHAKKTQYRTYSLDMLKENSETSDSIDYDNYDEATSFDEIMEHKEQKQMFQNLCDLCKIEVDKGEFVTDFSTNKQTAINYVIALKFLGGLQEEQKNNILNRVFELSNELEMDL